MMEAVSGNNKDKMIALSLTIGIHALLLVLFIFIVFITPIPPFEVPPSPEIEISLGMEGFGNTASGGSGQNDNQVATTTQEASPQMSEPNPTNNAAPSVITDPSPVDPTVYVPNNMNQKADNATPKEPEASKQLLDALNKIKSNKNQQGKGQGTGDTGGSGTGTSQGIGEGGGMGIGSGTPGWDGSGNTYDLKGRLLLKKPDQMTDSHEEGIVVVEIIVDETGKVIKATPGQRGTTTTSSNLFSKARQAAFSVRFNPSPDGIKEQRGTYTFKFVLE